MNAIRRTAVLLGIIATVVVGSSIPAAASFSDSTTPRSVALSTGSVVAPTGLKVVVRCEGSTLFADVTWTRSTSARVSAYAIDATINTDVMSFRAAGTAGGYTYTTGRLWGAYAMPVRVTVTTETQYGWTKASAPLVTTVTTC